MLRENVEREKHMFISILLGDYIHTNYVVARCLNKHLRNG